jgi:hypothetical protein
MDREASRQSRLNEVLTQASPEVRQVVLRVLQEEKEWLYMERPRLTDELVTIIKEIVK